MTNWNTGVEDLLTRAATRWRWLRFLRHSVTLATIVTGLVLLLGIGMVCGYFTSPSWMTACFGLLALAAIIAWFAIGLAAGIVVEDRSLLAAALERGHQPLMDRLNTLVFLRESRDSRLETYADQIAQQTRDLLSRDPPPLPFSSRQAVTRVAPLLFALFATILFYGHFHPWEHMLAAQPRDTNATKMDNASLEIPARDDPSEPAATAPPWGEVRISRPGTDVRATLLDIIPLQIEAMADRPLAKVEWFTSVNQQGETRHELPAPDDPRSGVYQLELPLPDYQVETWAVLSYYAQATTEDGRTYRSNTYFVEVVPFREELERTSGGPQGPGLTMLDQLTAMIERQQEVVRQTDRLKRSADQPEEGQPESAQQEALDSLARVETELGRATQHIAAVAKSQLNDIAATRLDRHFDAAETALKRAEGSLREAKLADATQEERNALTALVATRKEFQSTLRDYPAALAQEANQLAAEREPEAPPEAAGRSPEKASEWPDDAGQRPSAAQSAAESDSQMPSASPLQRQLESARKFVQKTLLAQRNLERAAIPPPRANSPRSANQQRSARLQKLAERQRALQRSLEDFVKRNRQSFAQCQRASASAQGAMAQAAQSMEEANRRARQDAGVAADALQQLDDALEKRQQQDQLAKAHELRQALDKQIAKLNKCQKQGASAGQCQQLARGATSVAGQLGQIARQESTGQQFGPQLRKALSNAKEQQLRADAEQLAEAPDRGARQRAAGQLAKRLQEIAQAFDASCPSLLGQGSQSGSLWASGQEAIARGIQPLESIARSQTGQRRLSSRDRSRMMREAIANLQSGVSDLYGSNQRSEPAISQLERKLKQPNTPVDMRTVRQLLSEIQRLSREVAPAKELPTGQVDATHIDPDRLPPAYRQSIEKYFERLSEDR